MRLRISASSALLVLTATLCAQTPATSSSMANVEKARLDVSRLEDLVREGAIAKNRLSEAQAKIEDAKDEAILKRSLFGFVSIQDIEKSQIEEMLAAARRRVDRMTVRVDTMQKLVEEGVVAKAEILPELEEMAMRKQTLELAESRAKTFSDLMEMVQAEQDAEARAAEAREQANSLPVAERFDGNGRFELTMLKAIQQAYAKKFERDLPISALGMTEVHRTMGFDHRDRVDVALSPDSAEGAWLRKFLETNKVPYFAFRSFVAGQATAPHIHIGPPSLRLPRTLTSAGTPSLTTP